MATFGYTQIGALNQATGQRMTGSVFTCPENGVAESISFYSASSGSGAARTVKCAIYRHSDSAKVGETESITITSWGVGWITLNFPDPKPQLQANVDYVLIAWNSAAGGAPRIAYDSGDFPEQGHYQTLTSLPFPDPANFSHENRKYSIYCTYTPAGGVYEISVDAIVKTLSTPAHETTYNISKDASVASQSLHTQETTFNLIKDAITKALADLGIETTFNVEKEVVVKAVAEVIIEKVAGAIYEIFLDAIATAQTTFSMESAFNISPEAVVKALAEASIGKEGEIKVAKLFLIIGDLAIQIQG